MMSVVAVIREDVLAAYDNLLSAVVGHVDPVAHPDLTGSRVVHPSVRVGGLGRLVGLRRLARVTSVVGTRVRRASV